MPLRPLVGALAIAAALAGCQRSADSGASSDTTAVRGATGKGTADASGQRSPQPGTGLQGGLGSSSGQTALGAGPAASSPSSGAAAAGSTNTTPKGSVGNRP